MWRRIQVGMLKIIYTRLVHVCNFVLSVVFSLIDELYCKAVTQQRVSPDNIFCEYCLDVMPSEKVWCKSVHPSLKITPCSITVCYAYLLLGVTVVIHIQKSTKTTVPCNCNFVLHLWIRVFVKGFRCSHVSRFTWSGCWWWQSHRSICCYLLSLWSASRSWAKQVSFTSSSDDGQHGLFWYSIWTGTNII